VDKFPELYDSKTKNRVQIKGEDTINTYMIQFRTCWNWCMYHDKVSHNPFKHLKIEQPNYGEPVVLSKNELDKLYYFNVNDDKLSLVKDTFLLSTYLGCRIGDYKKLTKLNIVSVVNEQGNSSKNVEYFQNKKRKYKKLVSIPLNLVAQEIISRYYFETKNLTPRINGDYNELLKVLFEKAGLNYKVRRINPKTGEEELVPFIEFVSSKLSRKTFISILVNTFDNMDKITSLTGHERDTPHLKHYIKINNDSKKEYVDIFNPSVTYDNYHCARSIG